MAGLDLHDLRTISIHQSFHGWPTVARLKSGRLLVVSSAGREQHACPFGQVHLIRSNDDGRTWSAPEVLVNGPLDDRDAGVMQTAKGTVMVNWFTSVAWLRRLEQAEAKGREAVAALGSDGFVARCQKVRSLMSEDLIRRELGTWIIRSTDSGGNWSPRIDCGVGSPHGPTQLADGRLLFIGYAKSQTIRSDAGSPYSPMLVSAESTDDGCSWRTLCEIPQRPSDPAGTYHEPHVVQAPDGRIIVHIRTTTRYILQSVSEDGGQSFSVPSNTGLLGFPAHLLVLHDGRLLTTYGYRYQPYGIRAALSDDAGRTWSEPMVLDEKPTTRDLGYPSTVELDDGTFLSVWYEQLPGAALATLQVARWSLR